MINWILKIFTKKEQNLGANLDPEEVLAALPHFDEMVAKANKVDWKPLNDKKLPSWPTADQDGSSSCVAQTLAAMAMMLYWLISKIVVRFSAKWFYFPRVNRPNEGMTFTDSSNQFATRGALPFVFMPSDGLGEAEMNTINNDEWLINLAEVFRINKDLVLLPVRDIDTIASVIQTTGKPVMVWFRFGTGEWGKVPKILTKNLPYAHSVTVPIPFQSGEMSFGIYEGEKAIVIKDSWGEKFGTFSGNRIIKESFFKERNILAAYPIKFKFQEGKDGRPTYDGSIVSLQDCLKFEGLFPKNIESTGVLGNITKQAIVKLQQKYGLDPVGIVGPKTTELLKKIYG